ncbi:hypothetical protein EOE67_15305 [Rheinheimera riviphila]|uniref:Uncharacterized protein n=1 Tax=Rheinheimera riviphila TaxID=1834037 RepID=A0A437QIY8_9GAMM|nr:hypothetical protein [Rheinheimera riviphila]RVU34414.1 hypothetical protein EOE67_15305 [Rheinheimera riviphila]
MKLLNLYIGRGVFICVALGLLNACSKQYDVVDGADIRIIQKKEYMSQVTRFETSNQQKIRYVVTTTLDNKHLIISLSSTFVARDTGFAIAVHCASATLHYRGKDYSPVAYQTRLNIKNCDQKGWISAAGSRFPDADNGDLDIVFSLDEALTDDFQITLPAILEVDTMDTLPAAENFANIHQTKLTMHRQWFRENLYSGIR